MLGEINPRYQSYYGSVQNFGGYILLGKYVATTKQDTVSFQNIPQFYNHLEVTFSGRMAGSGNNVDIGARFNGNFSSIYNNIILQNNTATYTASAAQADFGLIVGPGSPAGYTGNSIMRVPNYTNKIFYKNATIISNSPTLAVTPITTISTCTWYSTAAIYQLDFIGTTGSPPQFDVGSVFCLYGII